MVFEISPSFQIIIKSMIRSSTSLAFRPSTNFNSPTQFYSKAPISNPHISFQYSSKRFLMCPRACGTTPSPPPASLPPASPQPHSPIPPSPTPKSTYPHALLTAIHPASPTRPAPNFLLPEPLRVPFPILASGSDLDFSPARPSLQSRKE